MDPIGGPVPQLHPVDSKCSPFETSTHPLGAACRRAATAHSMAVPAQRVRTRGESGAARRARSSDPCGRGLPRARAAVLPLQMRQQHRRLQRADVWHSPLKPSRVRQRTPDASVHAGNRAPLHEFAVLVSLPRIRSGTRVGPVLPNAPGALQTKTQSRTARAPPATEE